MANVLIVGADHLGKIKTKLQKRGFHKVIHMNGRKVNMVRRSIPEQVDVIFIVTDFVNHNLAKVIKQKAKHNQVPTFFVKRSWCSFAKVLDECEDRYLAG